MLMDNHGTHCTPEFIKLANKNHIRPLPLIPHLTHCMQPLDVSVFQPYKHWHDTVRLSKMSLQNSILRIMRMMRVMRVMRVMRMSSLTFIKGAIVRLGVTIRTRNDIYLLINNICK